jgi:endonuclease/exonuclease/phosphatase family metal-dependent hydrolase
LPPRRYPRFQALVVTIAVACGHPSETLRGTPTVPDARDGGAPDAAPPDPSAPDARATDASPVEVDASSYDAPGIRILRGLGPDIALLQELKYPAGIRALVDAAFGPEFVFAIEVQAGGIPNGIVSRYPILESGEWEDAEAPDRDFAYARIDIPGAIDLWAVSVHLKTSDAASRSREARALVGYVQAQVPPGDYLVIGGDLNTSSEAEAALVDLGAVGVVASSRPADRNGNHATNATRTRPYDWVLASAPLDHLRMPVRIGAQTYCDGLVFDSRVWGPLAEVSPVQAGDSSAPNMQHMPVVRDFYVAE